MATTTIINNSSGTPPPVIFRSTDTVAIILARTADLLARANADRLRCLYSGRDPAALVEMCQRLEVICYEILGELRDVANKDGEAALESFTLADCPVDVWMCNEAGPNSEPEPETEAEKEKWERMKRLRPLGASIEGLISRIEGL